MLHNTFTENSLEIQGAGGLVPMVVEQIVMR